MLRDLAGAVLDDQVDALHAAAERHPVLDLSRVAIRGWSFGGYLAALAVLRRPDVFHAAIAGAPVTDWRLYDTHYTERYLGDPDQRAGRRTAQLGPARTPPALERPLLLIHGLADDNVVAAHTLQLSSALLAAGRPHEVVLLPDVTHMARSTSSPRTCSGSRPTSCAARCRPDRAAHGAGQEWRRYGVVDGATGTPPVEMISGWPKARSKRSSSQSCRQPTRTGTWRMIARPERSVATSAGTPGGVRCSISSASARSVAARATGTLSSRPRSGRYSEARTLSSSALRDDGAQQGELAVGEPGQVGGLERLGGVDVAAVVLDAPADVEDGRGVAERLADLLARLRVEGLEHAQGHGGPAGGGLGLPRGEPSGERLDRRGPDLDGRGQGQVQRVVGHALAEALARDLDLLRRPRTPTGPGRPPPLRRWSRPGPG